MVREEYSSVTKFRKALELANVILAKQPEHIGREKDQHWPDDHDGIEHWRVRGDIFRQDGTPELIWIGYWKDTLGYWGGAEGAVYPDRKNGDYNRLMPIAKEEDTTSLRVRALTLAVARDDVWSAWVVDERPDCVVIGCYQELEGTVSKVAYAVREVGEALDIKPYKEE